MTYPKLSQTKRRQQVAQLRLRGLTMREIADTLTSAGEKISHVTVSRDLGIIESDWRQSAARDLGEHKGRLLAEAAELRRVLWSQPELDAIAILRGLEFEAKLLGLYGWLAPATTIEAQIVELGMNPSDVLRQVERLLADHTEEE